MTLAATVTESPNAGGGVLGGLAVNGAKSVEQNYGACAPQKKNYSEDGSAISSFTMNAEG